MRRLCSMMSGFLLVLVASPALAQRNQATLEASILRGTAGYARQVGARVYAGVEVGFGFPQVDRTLSPDSEQGPDGFADFEEYLHVGAFLRFAPSEHFEVDAGVRAAIADLWSCGASDCWPAPFAGVYVQPMVGWRRLKFGPRLVAGWIDEGPPEQREGGTNVVALNPFTARLTIPW